MAPSQAARIETPNKSFGNEPIEGFFAYLDDYLNYHRPELRLVMDSGDGLCQHILHLHQKTITESIASRLDHSGKMLDRYADAADFNGGLAGLQGMTSEIAKASKPFVSVLLYICSALSNDVRDAGGSLRQPKRPKPKKVKGGSRIFPPDRPTIWETGYRMGKALVRARTRMTEESSRDGATHASPGPHIRRAHWHSYWTGLRIYPEKRSLTVKWLPPIPVAVGEHGELIPTIWLVK